MRFHSTNNKIKNISFKQAVRLGLAPDGGLFMPDGLPKLPQEFFKNISRFSFRQIARKVAAKFIREIPKKKLDLIIKDALNFSIPLEKLTKNIYLLELFHGPTMAFKDIGARFLARTLGYFLKNQKQQLNIIVATSGDTGSAVASGFFKVPNIKVYILYPSGKVSPLQEKQLTTYGHNITALEVKGSFDDCQRLAKQILSDSDFSPSLNPSPGQPRRYHRGQGRGRGGVAFSSANSINFGRLLPQSFYYFWAFAQLQRQPAPHPPFGHPLPKGARGKGGWPVIVVPSGNFGNLFAGLMAKRMGLPVYKFIAATNSNNIVPEYLKTGKFKPKKSKKTLSNAMDVGNPSNFARMLELYRNDYREMGKDILGISVTDQQTRKIIKQAYLKTGNVLDPHTSVGVTAALKYQKQDKSHPIVVLSTAHPAKFKEIVEPIIHKKIKLPKQLQAAMKKKKKSIKISTNYGELKKLLIGADKM